MVLENIYSTMNHYALCGDWQLRHLRSYRRLADYPFEEKKITGDFFSSSNTGSQRCFVIKRGHSSQG